MKWKKEIHPTQRGALIKDLRDCLSFWRQRRVALGAILPSHMQRHCLALKMQSQKRFIHWAKT